MNERIRLLAEQAEISRLEYNSDTMMTERIQEFDKEKFAELIVRECSKVITQGGYWNHALKGRTPASPSEIAKMVEDYFGVQ